MKKRYGLQLVIIFTLLRLTNSFSQCWEQMPLGATGQLYSMDFISEDVGWIIEDGKVYKTINGGDSWMYQYQILNDYIIQIKFYDSSNGWFLTSMGKLYYSSDGGNIWDVKYDGVYSLRYIFPKNLSLTWACAANGKILKSTDGGSNWEESYTDLLGEEYYKIQFVDSNLGFAANLNTGCTTGCPFLKTTDGGISWQKTYVGGYVNTGFHFTNDSFGIILSFNKYYISNDYGQTWQSHDIPNAYDGFELFCLNDSSFWFGGWSYIRSTQDGGNSWVDYSFSNVGNFSFNGIQFINKRNGFAIHQGETGTAWHYKLPVISINQPQMLNCIQQQIQLQAFSSTSSNNFQWYSSNGGNIVTGANTSSPTVNSPGTYKVIVTTSSGCIDSISVNVTDDDSQPIANSGTGYIITCNQPSVTLNGNNSINAISFQWTTDNGNILSGQNTANPLVNAPGTYQLKVTDINGCTAISNTVVSENKIVPTVSISGSNLTCSNSTTQLYVSTNAQNPSFSWSGPNGFLSSNSSPIVSLIGNYSVTVTDGNNGCTNSSNKEILQDGNPPGASVSGSELNCNNSTTSLNVTSSGTGLTYLWSGPGINTSNQQLDSPVVSTPGVYSVTVTNPTNGCSSIGQTTINQNLVPPIANTGSNYILQCGFGVTLNGGASVDAISFIWLNASGTVIGSNTSIPTQNVNEPGIYSLIVVGANGCRDTAQTIVQGSSFPTNASVTAMDVACKGNQDGTLQVQSVTGGVLPFLYSLNNGTFQSETLFEHLAPGTYAVIVKDANGCTFEVKNNVITEPSEFLEAKISAPTSGTVPLNTEVELQIISNENADDLSFNWSGNGLSCATCPNPKITPSSSSIYHVTVTNSKGCTASASEYIYVKSESSDESHVITPGNQNGENDVLIFPQLSGGSYPLSELVIFNRWGSIIYTTKPYQNNWRGTNQDGLDMPQGTYFFILYLDQSVGKLVKGDVLVLR